MEVITVTHNREISEKDKKLEDCKTMFDVRKTQNKIYLIKNSELNFSPSPPVRLSIKSRVVLLWGLSPFVFRKLRWYSKDYL